MHPGSSKSAVARGSQRMRAEDWLDENILEELLFAESAGPRTGAAYARWIQSSLNGLIGAGLAVDGAIGPQTRTAVRAFQALAGLATDGLVGPATERAMIAAGAGPPPSPGGAAPPPLTPGAPTGSALRDSIVATAIREWERWGRGTKTESDAAMHAILKDYWVRGTGSARSEANWWSSVPWSAAFISWVLRIAGAGDAFRYSASHATYVHAAKANRVAGNTNPFKAYRVSEFSPRLGDVVCRDRGSGANYDNVAPGMATHCDIVVRADPGKLTAIGGNLGHSVKTSSVAVNSAGRITTPGYFAVIQSGT